MGTALTFWYLQSPSWAYGFYLRSIAQLEITFGVRDMLHNLRRPLFQDYTWQGRLIGLIIRLLRVLIGLIFYLALAVLYLAGYLIWLAFPVLCLVSIVGAFIGTGGTS